MTSEGITENTFNEKIMRAKMSKEEFEEKWCFTKKNVELGEYIIHKMVYNAGIINVPKIYSYDKKEKIMVMQKICNMSISDFYGDEAVNVPPEVMTTIQKQIKELYNYGVCYPDITGYNFIEYYGKIFVIDFGHAELNKKSEFVEKFINGLCEWNPDFK